MYIFQESLDLSVWDAVDFERNTIAINHTVTSCNLDVIESDTTKNKSSLRTLPLVPIFREKLLTLKEEQKENRRLCGRSYNTDYLSYLCVDEMGNLIKPNYVTTAFVRLLELNDLRVIRYHHLRHTCASLLVDSGVPMKAIQMWLGHSTFSTTADIYAHLDYHAQINTSTVMGGMFENERGND